jgi:tetratricopeptide (TPR) repeat protein
VSDVIGDLAHAISDAFAIPALLAICLILLIVATRIASFTWYFLQRRRRRPLVVRLDTSKEQDNGSGSQDALNDRLLAYLAADAQGSYVIAPGSGGPAAPGVTAEAFEPSSGWQAALFRMAIARQPSYQVDVTWSDAREQTDGRPHQAVVRISRTPGDRIVASDSFSERDEEELVQIVGCFCIMFLRGRPGNLRQTPRWERWGQSIHGYRAYRSGLEYQHRAEISLDSGGQAHASHHGLDEYREALLRFDDAARLEPANLLVQLHRAALLEFTGDYRGALDIYQKCHTLWPEHIETTYRLGNARKNLPDHIDLLELRQHFENIERQLALRSLVRFWWRTLRPSRWNPGERRYWRSWLQLWLPGRVTRRAMYIHAVAIAKLLAELSSLLREPEEHSDKDGARSVDHLMADLAHAILRRGPSDSWMRLLHPERSVDIASEPGHSNQEKATGHPVEHDHLWHLGMLADVSRIPSYSGGQYRSDIGWLAVFNTACFFSLAIKLGSDRLPAVYSQDPEDWRDDCARAAIRELGMLVRNPTHALEPDWLGTDPDLAPLRQSPTGMAWTSFVGLPTPEVVIPRQSPRSRSQPHR